MAEPATPVAWVALLAAILLPAAVAALGFWWNVQTHAARHTDELRMVQLRLESQSLEISRLRREVTMLEEDLDLVLDID